MRSDVRTRMHVGQPSARRASALMQPSACIVQEILAVLVCGKVVDLSHEDETQPRCPPPSKSTCCVLLPLVVLGAGATTMHTSTHATAHADMRGILCASIRYALPQDRKDALAGMGIYFEELPLLSQCAFEQVSLPLPPPSGSAPPSLSLPPPPFPLPPFLPLSVLFIAVFPVPLSFTLPISSSPPSLSLPRVAQRLA